MTPRQFVGEYGTPIPLTYNPDPGQVLVIPADPDRYLIVFWSTDGQLDVRFGEDPEQESTPWRWAPGGVPVSFDHAHTASLCGSAFTLGPLGSRGSFTILVGRMARIGRRPASPEKYRGNAKRKALPDRPPERR